MLEKDLEFVTVLKMNSSRGNELPGVPDMSLKDYKYCHYYPDNNSRNKHRTNNKISFIDNPYIFWRCVSCTTIYIIKPFLEQCFCKKTVLSDFIKALWSI